jgi:DNA polymerase elongation subunit (family B)
MDLYLDIETIPTRSNRIRSSIADAIKPPGNMKKAETIAEWEANNKQAAVEEEINRTSLDGAYGNICCIGWAIDSQPVKSSYGEDEKKVLGDFIAEINKDLTYLRHVRPRVVGHNVLGFDIRFIWQRAIVLGIKVPNWFPRDPKPWSNDVFDTMTAFAGQRNSVSLQKLADALGFEGKGDMDGSKVAKTWAAGQHDKVAAYCCDDVELTRQIHKHMQIAFGETNAF